MLPGSVDPALAASMLSAGFGAEQPGRLDDQGASLCTAVSWRSAPPGSYDYAGSGMSLKQSRSRQASCSERLHTGR